MKTIRKNIFASEGYMFSLIRLIRVSPKRIKCTLCLLCAVAITFSCIPMSSVTTNATIEEYCQQSFELYPDEKNNEKYITLNGVMPENASAEAIDVTAEYSDMENFPTGQNSKLISDTGETAVLAAYDISITGRKGDFQPIDNNPILVEIVNPKICSGSVTELWHITDDGKYEQIHNFTIQDGKISFYATGFSIYAIVNAPDPYIYPEGKYAASVDELTGSGDNAGFYLCTGSHPNRQYISSRLNKNSCLLQTTEITEAAVWYFENDSDGHKMYTYVDGVKKYLHSTSLNDRNVKLSETAADCFHITVDGDSFLLNKTNSNLYLQYSNSGQGIRYYTGNGDANNMHMHIIYANTIDPPKDVYHFNGRTYGLMRYPGGTLGYGLMADPQNNAVDMTSLVVRINNNQASKTLYVAQDCDIAMWTFHSVSKNIYTLSVNVNGTAKYLRFSGNTLSLDDDEQNATPLTLTTKNNCIMLSSNGKSICFDGSTFSLRKTNQDDSGQWLYLTSMSGLEDDNYICYSADKISVSEVTDKSIVMIYTRIWNDAAKRYDFYAVDHDGTLYACYERGDNIMWVGNRVNTMQWEFTEYTYDDGTSKHYYELYNPYSRKYISPQLKDGQMLSDSKIGINLPGRRKGEYYTDIIAWDDLYYAYAGLKNDTQNIISAPRSKADTYYFAVIEKPVPTLTKVETIDNHKYGITMKMIDFPPPEITNQQATSFQSRFLEQYADSTTFATSELLSTNLNGNGYPTVIKNNKSLSELFAGATEVNHLFIESIYNDSGYFEFDSCQNFATLLDEQGNVTNDFTVYKELGTTDSTSKSTLKHGQFFPYNNITAGQYAKVNTENLYGPVADPKNAQTGLLPDSDPRKYEKLHTVGDHPNYHNGMEMEASFIQTPDGKDAWGRDIIFEFTGDDDFWLYVDGELVIDLGGIHSALAGKVNFATGDVTVEKRHTNLREIFESNYKARHSDAAQAEVDAYLSKFFKDGTSVFKDYSPHTMKLFYMERGAGASNLHMRFNISYTIPPKVLLTKKVTGSEDMDFSLAEYPFQIWYRDNKDTEKQLTNTGSVHNVTYRNSTQKVDYLETYNPPNSSVSYDSVYFLNPDMTTEIHFPEETVEYRIIECGINTDVYDNVRVNGVTVQGSGNTNHLSFDSGWQAVKDTPSLVFENHVAKEALRTLSFKKVLCDLSGNEVTAEQDSATFNFRLSLSKNSQDTPSLANLYKYHVTDPQGFLCKWDVPSQKFTSIGTSFYDISTLEPSQKELVTFETSMHGAISKIPAGYTVHVPNLPVGTKFIVTERENEIPPGYQFVSYERVGDTYFVADSSAQNAGYIRENDSPFMLIKNKRGWGMEATKIWSDSDHTFHHAPIYTAVYANDDLIEGTVKRLCSPSTSVRYYFDTLKAGTDFKDYSIYEVTVENPQIASDGVTVLNYSSVTKLNHKDRTEIGNSDYIVEYTEGTVQNNVKKNTITNIRTDGIVITLYDMNTKEPLSNGTFVLKQGDTELGTFISDSDGRVTVMHDLEHGKEYTLTETSPPGGYIGLPDTAVFSIDSHNEIRLSGNEEQWQKWRLSENIHDYIIGYIDLFNKPYTLRVIKEDSITDVPLAGAHFSLYRGYQGMGGYVKDMIPVSGYDDLVTDSSGIVPFPDGVLLPDRYYLTETAPPENYAPLDTDIIFTITESGNFVIESAEHKNFLTKDETDEVIYSLHVPNTPFAKLTVTKTVQGNFGNSNKDFTFTLTVEGAAADDEYEWSKNGIPQTVRLHSGGTFTLKHNDSCTIILPKEKNVTICENSENYAASFQLDSETAETVNSKTFTLSKDTTLAVTNTLNGTVPTGIKMNMPAFLLTMTVSFAAVLFILYRKKCKCFSE